MLLGWGRMSIISVILWIIIMIILASMITSTTVLWSMIRPVVGARVQVADAVIMISSGMRMRRTLSHVGGSCVVSVNTGQAWGRPVH